MKKLGLKLGEHEYFGKLLWSLLRESQSIFQELSKSYPTRSKHVRLCGKVIEAINNLRCELDSAVFKEYPKEATPGIYYLKRD